MVLNDYTALFPEIGQEIWHFPILSRSMPLAKKLIDKYSRTANGRIIWTDILTNAKGRFERKWIAEKGGLWITCSIFDEFLPQTSSFFPLIFGLVMLKCAYDFKIFSAKIKWINDLHFNGKKLGGVLIEKYKEWYIVGIGMNINNDPPKNLSAISFKQILGMELPLKKIIERLIYWLRYYLGYLRFYEKAVLEEEKINNLIIQEFKKFSDTIGRCVYYSYNLDSKNGIIGKAINIDEKGSLIIKTENQILSVNSGEIVYLL